jgi:mRNA interferase MazF
VKRGEIWLAKLDPTVGSEIRKTRPCVVILRTVIVAPMTTKAFSAGFRVPITHKGRKGLILLDQIRAIDKTRLLKRTGVVDPSTLRWTLATLSDVFAE